MKVLVTGGAGYIGSHAVKKLLETGHEVVVLDDLSQGHKEAVFHASSGKVGLVQGNVAETQALEAAYKILPFEAVLHFAAFIEVGESVADPSKYYQNNFVRAVTMLDHLRALGIQKIVFSSTAAVYGNPLSIPIREDAVPNPINPYGHSKRMVEIALEDYRKAYGLSYTILRYFNVAGASPDSTIGEAHEPESHLIPRILASALDEAIEMSIYGTDYPTSDGTCIRDYIHVDDLVSAHVLALEALKEGTGEIYNLGSENGFSVREVLAACERVTGKDIQKMERDRRPGDPAILVASSEKIRRNLGWKRKYPNLETIVEHAWKWHQSHPLGYKSFKNQGIEWGETSVSSSL